jgi:hypothetical protein
MTVKMFRRIKNVLKKLWKAWKVNEGLKWFDRVSEDLRRTE